MYTTIRKVVGVGLGRTGTTSLHEALVRLGFESVHHPPVRDARAFQSGKAFLDALQNCDAVANGTGSPYPRIDAVFPGTRFILTTRPLDAWLASKEKHVAWEDRNWDTFDRQAQRVKRLVREHVYGSFTFDRERWGARFEEHDQAVRAYFRGRTDLLVIDLSQGVDWDGFCAFLGVEPVGTDFPRVNSTREMAVAEKQLEHVRRALAACLPPDAQALIVDEGQIGRVHERSRPFLERDGAYWGRPADSRQAIRELERMRREGADVLVFPESSRWWLAHYDEFGHYLDTHYRRRDTDAGHVLYELSD